MALNFLYVRQSYEMTVVTTNWIFKVALGQFSSAFVIMYVTSGVEMVLCI